MIRQKIVETPRIVEYERPQIKPGRYLRSYRAPGACPLTLLSLSLSLSLSLVMLECLRMINQINVTHSSRVWFLLCTCGP